MQKLKNPLISIIIPTHNRDYILWKAIQSIQQQTYSNWELIIVDDRSTDATYKMMREFKQDKRIKHILNKYKHSPAGARRFGQKNAKGDLIAYLDSDNSASNLWLQEIANLFENDKNAVFAYVALNFKVDYVDKNENIKTLISEVRFANPPSVDMLWSHEFEGDPNGFVHRSDIDKAIDWDEELDLYEDYDFSLQLAKKYPKGMRYINQALVNYVRRYGEAGICNDATYKSLLKNLKYLDKKHSDFTQWNKNDWHKEEIRKFKKLADQGLKPIDRILAKYGNKN
jgi:glycosyltransferase involved in cell wall biosynthesis